MTLTMAIWKGRNKLKHSKTKQEQYNRQRKCAFDQVSKCYSNASFLVRLRYGHLFSIPLSIMRDKSLVHLTKWLETYHSCVKHLDAIKQRRKQQVHQQVTQIYKAHLERYATPLTVLLQQPVNLLIAWVKKTQQPLTPPPQHMSMTAPNPSIDYPPQQPPMIPL